MTVKKLIVDDKANFDLKNFLSSGAFMAISDDRVLLGSSPSPSNEEDPAGPCLYAPDFFLREENPWFQFERVFSLKKTDFKNILEEHRFSKWEVRGEIPPDRESFFNSDYLRNRGPLVERCVNRSIILIGRDMDIITILVFRCKFNLGHTFSGCTPGDCINHFDGNQMA